MVGHKMPSTISTLAAQLFQNISNALICIDKLFFVYFGVKTI